MAVAIQTPAISAQPVASHPTSIASQPKVGTAYLYGGIPRLVTQGQSDTIVGPGGVIMTRRQALSFDQH